MSKYLLVQSPTDGNWHVEMPALELTKDGEPTPAACFRLAEAERLYQQVRILAEAPGGGGSRVTYVRSGQGEWKRA